ncbi:MAG: MASE1 domain-containing protein, partial [Bacteroidales bacterium]|nr:MASE1 domain-containing protein [Bacteroidales bacterium]
MKKQLLYIIFIAIVYLVVARVGLLFAQPGTNATPLWLPTGIAISSVILLGHRIWPGITIGAFAANFSLLTDLNMSVSVSIMASLSTATGNTLEALLAVLLIRRLTLSKNPFNHTGDVVKFIIFAAMISTTVSATIGTVTFKLSSGDWNGFMPMWLTWWLGNATGVLLITPLALTYSKQEISRWVSFPGTIENYLLVVSLFAVWYFVFSNSYPLLYLLIPALIFAAYKFGRFSSAAVIFIISVISVIITVNNSGPFATYPLNESLLLQQGFIGCIAITTMVLSSLVFDQKKTVETLWNSENYNRLLFNTSPVGLALCKMDGSLVDINPAYAKILGRSIDETLRMTYWDITPEKYASPEAIQLKSLEETGRYGPYEKEHIHADGHLVPVLLNGLIIERNGEKFIWSSVEDITELKRIDVELHQHRSKLEQLIEERTSELNYKSEQLEANELALLNLVDDLSKKSAELEQSKTRAESADRLKSVFLATMSHELRTPLNSIIGFTGILLQQLAGPLNKEQSKQLQMVKNSSHHLLDLINDVLDISRIEAGELVVSFEPFDVSRSIQKAISYV